MKLSLPLLGFLLFISLGFSSPPPGNANQRVDLGVATLVVRPDRLGPAEKTAARVLVEEVQKRTGLAWKTSTVWPRSGPVIAISSGSKTKEWGKTLPHRTGNDLPEGRAEGYRLVVTSTPQVVWIVGADSRGALYGVGEFLRRLNWSKGKASILSGLDVASAPALPIRGHQLGYRAQANSYDGWDEKQFEQYIRELSLFGVNAIEDIPFQDGRKAPLMPLPRDAMNRKLSEICARYEMEYWIWTPADFDLRDQDKRTDMLKRHEALFRDCPRMDGIFFPGGDPGDNPPDLVIPYLSDLAALLARHHPNARVWLSMQGFDSTQVDAVYRWLDKENPRWLGGLVAGPSSPPIPETRKRLDRRYRLRDYPDITHTVRCQYEVPFWDPAFSLTLGREPCNPRPIFYKLIQDRFGPYTDGFITYSDGIQDDVNKVVMTRLGWAPETDIRLALVEYARFFFGPDVAERAADGLLALEKNWEDPLATNGGVDGTLALWQQLEKMRPDLGRNWRWQLCLLRAYYDAYTRHRLIFESALENEANATLASAPVSGARPAMWDALAVLRRAVDRPIHPEWRARIEGLCRSLFDAVKLQTSVPRYHASGYERGCVLDFVDYPLNNRWWLEDEFARIAKLGTESERLKSLDLIRTWESPGPGSYYDEVGNVGKSPHVVRGEGLNTDPLMVRNPNPGYWWWDEGKSRKRLTWQTSMGWPIALEYYGLDPHASYCVRMTGYGDVRLRMNGQLATPTLYGKEIGAFKEFPVPRELLKDGKLRLTFDPLDEHTLNWRQQSRVSEVWLLRR